MKAPNNQREFSSVQWFEAAARKLALMSFEDFVAQAWSEAGLPGNFVRGWHISLLCRRLQMISEAGRGRFMWASPPRSSKSSVLNVFWPAWVWAQEDDHDRLLGRWVQFLCLTHRDDLAVRDSQRCRRLIKSDWYQGLTAGRVQTMPDADQSSYFALEGGGSRRAFSLRAGVTGHDSDIQIVDDCYSTENVLSSAERAHVEFVWDEMLPSRVNHPTRNAVVLAAQRTATTDLHAHVMKGEDYRAGRWHYDAISGVKEAEEPHAPPEDQRAIGEVYWPGRFTPETVMALANTKVAQSAQIQQKPAKREGKVFGNAQWSIVDDWPRAATLVRYWDKAATEEGRAADPDYTAGVLMAVDRNGIAYVVDVVRGRWSPVQVEQRIRITAESDGTGVPIWIEEEGGSAGKDVTSNYQRNILRGFAVRGDRPTGPKLVRVDPYLAAAEAGNIRLVRGTWNAEFLAEHDEWTGGDAEHDDQIVAAAGAFKQLALHYDGEARGVRVVKLGGF